MRKRKFKTSGVTLIELLVAAAVIAAASAPLIGMFVMSARISAAAFTMSMASLVAQMGIEELIGTDLSELTLTQNPRFESRAEIIDEAVGGFEMLKKVRVTVYKKDGSELYDLECIIYATQTNFGGVK